MKRILFKIFLIGLPILGILAGCNLPSDSPTPEPTQTATVTIPATGTPIPVTSTPEYAPLCEPGKVTGVPTPASCRLPIAEMGSTFCNVKRPYNLIYINPGASYDVLTRGFTCTDAGIKNEKQRLTCTGPMNSDYEVRVCDPACAMPTVQAKTTQCPQGFNYDPLQGCCTQGPVQIAQNCTVLKLETVRCVVDCSVFKSKTDCNKNSIACVWDAGSKSCKPR